MFETFSDNLINKYKDRMPDQIIPDATNPYLSRWWIKKSSLGNAYLHLFHRPDDDRAMHDHPWWSLSLCLRGYMFEETSAPHLREIHPGDWRLRSAKFKHIIRLKEVPYAPWYEPAWTLFITGPKIREWGFHCPNGWMHWKHFESNGGCL